VKKAAYYPELKTQISPENPLYKFSANGLELLANTKADLMAAYLALFSSTGNPAISVNPAAFSDTLLSGGTTTEILTISNSGGAPTGDLSYNITENPAVDWLEVNPTSGTLTANQSEDVTLVFNAAGLAVGDYTTTLEIGSNDPVTPLLTIPVALHVFDVPVIAAAPDSVIFDTLAVNTESSQLLYIINEGNAELSVVDIISTNDKFTVDTTHFSVPVNDSVGITVTFAPVLVGLHTGWLKIASNDPNTDTLHIYMEGFADQGVGIAGNQALPQQFAVSPNYPNPFNPTTTINYQLPHAAEAELVIYNVLGQQVRRLVSGQISPGYYQATWDGRNETGMAVGSGIYIYRFRATAAGETAFEQIRKMILMK
jgi:hypothetical protein